MEPSKPPKPAGRPRALWITVFAAVWPLMAVGWSDAVAAAAPPHEEAGFTAYIADRIRQVLPSASVVVQGPLTIVLGEIQANLDRIHAACQRDADGCEQDVAAYVQGVVEVHREHGAAPTKDSVRLLVRGSGYVQAAQAQGADGRSISMLARPFIGGLQVLAALNNPRTVRLIAEGDLRKLNLGVDQVFELGAHNLRRLLPPLVSVAQPAQPGQIGQFGGNAYESSRLLLHDTWEPLVRAQGGVLVVIAPAPDLLLYVGRDDAQALDALLSLARRILVRAGGRMDEVLLRWRPEGWEPVAP